MSMPNKYKEGTKAILVRMPEEEKARVDRAAKAMGMTTTELARQAILERVDVIERLQGEGK
jgi:predicted DNA-binding protein